MRLRNLEVAGSTPALGTILLLVIVGNKYLENITIIKIVDADIQNITATIVVNIKNMTLSCFSSFDSDLFTEKENVYFSLMTTDYKQIKTLKKDIKTSDKYDSDCILNGNIVDFVFCEQSDYKYAIIDCGIFVRIEILNNSDLKLNDSVCAKGRLDIKKP